MTTRRETPIGFALCHGWAFEADALAPLHDALRSVIGARFADAACVSLDLGFGGNARMPELDDDRRWIAIGHSYGFAYLMQQPVAWQAAVAINGFTRFCRQPGRAEGTPRRLLDAMVARLATDPHATVQDFYQRCGACSAPPLQLDQAALTEHLIRLRDLDLTPPNCPTLALATSDDAIVPLALARACFAQTPVDLRELPGDHTSLLREPAMLAGLIAGWVETLHD